MGTAGLLWGAVHQAPGVRCEIAIVNSGFGGTPGEMPWEMCGLGGAKRASSSGLPPTVLEGLAQ